MRTSALRSVASDDDTVLDHRPADRPLLGPRSPGSVVLLTPDAAAPCGVGDFTQGLANAIQRRDTDASKVISLGVASPSLRALWRDLRGRRSIVCNLPLVAWKRLPIRPLLALAMARLRGLRAVVMLHEWRSLHPLRRLLLWPALVMAQRIVMFSPLLREEFHADPSCRMMAHKVRLAPLPPNIARPTTQIISDVSQTVADAKSRGRATIGVFGSIYPGKAPLAVLDIVQALKARGEDPLVVYIGGFVRASDNIDEIFWRQVSTAGLKDNVCVSGYVPTQEQLFEIFSSIDAFIYRLPEGLTARRSSILACVQSGRPVIVSAPATPNEFDHHPRFADLIKVGRLSLVGRNASPDDYADRVLQARRTPTAIGSICVDEWWDDLVGAIEHDL